MCAPGGVYVWITFGSRLVHRISIFTPNTKTTMKMAFRWAVLTLHSTNQRSESRGVITEIFGTTIELVDCRLGQCPWRNLYPHKNDYRRTHRQTASPAGVVLKSHPLHNYTRLQAKNARGVQLRCTLRVQMIEVTIVQEILPRLVVCLILRGTSRSCRQVAAVHDSVAVRRIF